MANQRKAIFLETSTDPTSPRGPQDKETLQGIVKPLWRTARRPNNHNDRLKKIPYYTCHDIRQN